MSTLRLVKHKDWYIPANAVSYKLLVKMGFPTTRIHDDSRGALTLVIKKHNVKVSVIQFKEVLTMFQEHLNSLWLKNEYRESNMRARSIELSVTKRKETGVAKKTLEKLKIKIDNFLRRWGLSGEAIYSEARGISKLYVDIVQSTTKHPVIRIKRNPQEVKKNIIEFGTHRLLTLVDNKMFHWWLEVKSGPNWVQVKYSKCLHTEVTNPTGLISDLMKSFNT